MIKFVKRAARRSARSRPRRPARRPCQLARRRRPRRRRRSCPAPRAGSRRATRRIPPPRRRWFESAIARCFPGEGRLRPDRARTQFVWTPPSRRTPTARVASRRAARGHPRWPRGTAVWHRVHVKALSPTPGSASVRWLPRRRRPACPRATRAVCFLSPSYRVFGAGTEV